MENSFFKYKNYFEKNKLPETKKEEIVTQQEDISHTRFMKVVELTTKITTLLNIATDHIKNINKVLLHQRRIACRKKRLYKWQVNK